MIWIAITLAACALLAWLLATLRRYEHESASAALREVQGMREELEALRLRVQALEAIAAEAALTEGPPESTAASLEPEESVSSPRPSRARS